MRFGLIAIAVCCIGFGGQAVAQTPPSDIERIWAEARAISPEPFSLDREHSRWLADRPTDAEADARWKGVWTRSAARDAAVRRIVAPEAALAQGCVDLGLNGCTAGSGGFLNENGGRLYWQIQDGSTEEDGATAGFVLLEGTPQGLRPVAWGLEGASYAPPVVVREGDAVYVAVAGRTSGTGHFNADRLYRWTPGAERPLTQIDNETWLDALGSRLPPGLGVWQGVDYAYDSLSARTSLWQDDDANCCPSGGDAWLNFAITGDALVLENVGIRDALFTLAQTVPVDVYDYAARSVGCDHWGGEEPYDAERRAEIERAVADLRCQTLSADGAAVKAKYADRPGLKAIIARAEAGSN